VPFIAYTLDVKVFKGSQPLVSAWPVHYADWFDTAFDHQYGGARWLADNVLRLESSGAQHRRDVPEDIVTVENNSGRALRLLTVEAADLFLILDVPEGWKTQLQATPQSGITDLSWIEAGGVLADGTIFRNTGVNFILPKGVEGAFHYAVDVQPGGIQIRETRHGAQIFSSR
jgi:hypothetical protein